MTMHQIQSEAAVWGTSASSSALQPMTPSREARMMINGKHDMFLALSEGRLKIFGNIFEKPRKVNSLPSTVIALDASDNEHIADP